MTRVSQLLEFEKQHGHLRVPRRYKEDPGLGNWVNKQRQQYRYFITGQKPCSLTLEKIEQLNRLGFCWDGTKLDDQTGSPISQESSSDDSDWWTIFRELQNCVSLEPSEASAASYAHARRIAIIPRQSRLGKWLHKQRSAELSAKQVDALNELDPEWRLAFWESLWEQRYRELQAYRIQHGDCCVPITYSENRPLARWVNRQRAFYNKNLLPPDRVERLNAIGFVWNRWEHEFAKSWVVKEHIENK